jgi:aspartyl/asparaginyl-tRNA synthetase
MVDGRSFSAISSLFIATGDGDGEGAAVASVVATGAVEGDATAAEGAELGAGVVGVLPHALSNSTPARNRGDSRTGSLLWLRRNQPQLMMMVQPMVAIGGYEGIAQVGNTQIV